MGVFLWIVIIGFIAGIIARLLMPGPNTPKGFVVTTILGIAGAFLATIIGDATGLYRPGQGAGLVGATIGALVIFICLEPPLGGWDHSRSRPLVSLPIQSSAESGRRRGPASARGYIDGRLRLCTTRR